MGINGCMGVLSREKQQLHFKKGGGRILKGGLSGDYGTHFIISRVVRVCNSLVAERSEAERGLVILT